MNKQALPEIRKSSQKDLNHKINNMLKILEQHSPLAVLKRCYEEIALYSLKLENQRPDTKFDALQNALPYIQSVIYSTNLTNAPKKTIEENEFQKLIKIVQDIYGRSNILAMFDDKSQSNNVVDELQIKARLEWLNVKGKRYRCYELIHLQELLSPHEKIFKKTFGMSVIDFINNLEKLEYSILRGYFEAWENINKFHKEFCDNAKKNPQYNLEELMVLRHKDSALNDVFAKILEYDLFNLRIVANFSEKLLEKLSYSIGENIDFGKGRKAYCPTKKLPVYEKPFLKYEDNYYCFEIQTLYDNIYRNIEKIILEDNPSYKDKWNKIQGRICHEITTNLFKKILPRALYLENNYYLYEGNWTENDLLIIFDKIALIVEIKAGKFKTKSPFTDFINYKQSVIKLLEEPINQALRIERLLARDSKIIFYDNNKKSDNNIKYILEQSKIEKIFLCSISLDNFNIVANNIPLLKEAGFKIPHNLPIWGLSIDELRVYSHLFEQESLTFLHFLQKRVEASNAPEINLNDELDHLALYFEFNDYIKHTKDLIKQNNVTGITYFDYIKAIDDYFIKQERYFKEEKKLPKPKQKMSEKLKELICSIQRKEQEGCSHVTSSMLDFSGVGREYLIHLLKTVLSKQFTTKRLQHINIIDVSVFCLKDNNTICTQKDMDDFVYASMLIAHQPQRYCLKIYFDSENRIYDTDIQKYSIEINQENKIKYANLITALMNGRKMKQLEYKKKIGRNDLCPCGSGRKYKKCCLRYYE